MADYQGNCEILMDNRIIVGKSPYCTITDLQGTMTASSELAGKLWIIQNLEKKDLYIKLYSYGKTFSVKIIITSAPPKQDISTSTKITFKVSGELKQVYS